MLRGKKILLGITGGIAAYKAAFLTRLLVKDGAEVKVVMTDAAKEFVTPLTFSVLSKNPVYSSFADKASGEWNNHVELALWADLILIAPASANTLAKFAHGICDNLLSAVYLSARSPVVMCPAMDLDMWQHPTTQNNIELLKTHGVKVIYPAHGELASGLTGEGRMEEPEKILSLINEYVFPTPLKGKKALVTAGPTYEKIDPVRFVGNRSSGKMGFAIARELSQQGAEVTLISGPTSLSIENRAIHRIDVESTQQMYDACIDNYEKQDIIVMCAAVADYKPEFTGEEKIKKYTKTDSSSENKSLMISLVPTQDILSELGKRRKKTQLLVGFALETTDELVHAKEKLQKKNLDMIVLNSLKDEGAGFGVDTNKVTIIDGQKEKAYPVKQKTEVAKDIVAEIVRRVK